MVSISETSIRFRCPNDHKLRVPLHYEGKRVACPVCSTLMIVGEIPPEPITESGAFRILNECDVESFREAQAKPQVAAAQIKKTSQQAPAHQCPRCKHPLERGVGRCPECKLCLDSSQKVLQRIYKAALRSMQ